MLEVLSQLVGRGSAPEPVANVNLVDQRARREHEGYIEYPSHYENGLDSPVGLVFRAAPVAGSQPRGEWFRVLPENMHEEQKRFLVEHAAVSRAA